MGLSREQERAAWYLAGIMDGEGSVFYREGKVGLKTKGVKISNTDLEIIRTTSHALEMLGVEHVVDGPIVPSNPRWKEHYSIVFTTYESIERFWKVVPTQSPEKNRRLAFIVNCQRRMLPRDQWPIDRINILYWEEGLTIEQVADHLGISKGRVRYYMEQGGIPKRTRKEQAGLRKVST